MYTGDKKETILLLSTDARLSHLLLAETQELCLSMRVESSLSALPNARLSALRLILWDMDTVALPATPALPADCPVFGISATDVPPPEHITLTRRLPRPFSVDALRTELLRIAAEGQAAAAEQPSSLVLQLDEDGLTLHAGDLTVTLTENEALLLSLLLQHRGEPVSKETLHRALCRGEDTPSGSNKVEVHLCNLRRKLEQPLGLRLISTVRGQGYRLLP